MAATHSLAFARPFVGPRAEVGGTGSRDDVRAGEIVTLEQQRQTASLGQSVAEQVADIQTGSVTASPAESHECGLRSLRLVDSGSDPFEARHSLKVVQPNDGALTLAGMHDDPGLDDRNGADQGSIAALDDPAKSIAFGLADCDGEERGRVDDDHNGRPWSSH